MAKLKFTVACGDYGIVRALAGGAVEQQQEILGADPWAYGLGDANRKNPQTVLQYCHQQGLIGRMMPLDDLFADTDLGDAGGGAENI